MAGIEEVFDYSFRWEYQGRGTIHVHVVAWVRFKDGKTDMSHLDGRSNQEDEKSALVQYLEKLFRSSVDVQCGNGSHCLLRYVTGYVSKASDALTFKQKQYEQKDTSQWRQTYRLLCKKAPLLPEMSVEFATLPLMESSFRGATIFAPVPQAGAGKVNSEKNASRALYEEYLKYQNSIAAFAKRDDVVLEAEEVQAKEPFIEWARRNTVVKNKGDGDEIEFAPKKRHRWAHVFLICARPISPLLLHNVPLQKGKGLVWVGEILGLLPC
jgi:hypothetical protein